MIGCHAVSTSSLELLVRQVGRVSQETCKEVEKGNIYMQDQNISMAV